MLQNFIIMVKNQFGKHVKIIHSDNGNEFKSRPMKMFYSENGIIHYTICVDSPQQNGWVERKDRHVLNISQAPSFQASVFIEFWGELVY